MERGPEAVGTMGPVFPRTSSSETRRVGPAAENRVKPLAGWQPPPELWKPWLLPLLAGGFLQPKPTNPRPGNKPQPLRLAQRQEAQPQAAKSEYGRAGKVLPGYPRPSCCRR